jgi:hypothetical protein
MSATKESAWTDYKQKNNLNGTFSPNEEECIKHAFFCAWDARAEYREREVARNMAWFEDEPQDTRLQPLTAEEIYNAYPRKVGKADAIKAIKKAQGYTPETCSKAQGRYHHLLERTQAYAAATAKWSVDDQRFIPHPATWFNRGSYHDDPKEWVRNSGLPTGRIHSSAIKTRE